MGKKMLNVAWLNGAMPMGKGGASGGGGVTINNQDKTVDITENGTTNVTADSEFTGLGNVTVNVAIPTEEKVVDVTENGTMEFVPESGYFSKVVVNTNVESGGGGTTPSRPTYTGHADVEGLKAIGWTDEDIAYYQANGVNWNEEDDQYHKVPEDNIALYGVLTASNISTYKDRIVYLPKIDTSERTSMNSMFKGCNSLVFIPHLDTSKVTGMNSTFIDCYSLVSIPLLNTSKVTNISGMFSNCNSLVSIPPLDTSSVEDISGMFSNCRSLVSIPQLNTSKVTNMTSMFSNCNSLVSIPPLDTSKVTGMASMFNSCFSLVSIPPLDTSNATSINRMFNNCYSLVTANLKNVKLACQLSNAALLSKESLLYIINNEASTSAITIELASYAYTRLANDPDVVTALSNHPKISLAS